MRLLWSNPQVGRRSSTFPLGVSLLVYAVPLRKRLQALLIILYCSTRRTASIIVALPCRTCSIAHLSIWKKRLHHQNLGSNMLSWRLSAKRMPPSPKLVYERFGLRAVGKFTSRSVQRKRPMSSPDICWWRRKQEELTMTMSPSFTLGTHTRSRCGTRREACLGEKCDDPPIPSVSS